MASLSALDLLDGWVELVATVDAGSIAGAARSLGLPRETVGRRLAALEERLGVRLLHRTTRRLSTTSAGEALVTRARRILAEAEDAAAAVRAADGVPRGKLRITIPPLQGDRRFGRMVAVFLERWPEVELEILATSRHVDLVSEGFDLAIRAGRVTDPSLVVRRLGGSCVRAVAAPSYLARRGTPATPQDLVHHECIRGLPGGQPARSWPLVTGGAAPVGGRLVTDDLGLQNEAAHAGFGIALLPDVMTASALRDGELVRLLPEVGADGSVSAAYPSREHLDPKIRVFVDHLAEWIATDQLPWDLGRAGLTCGSGSGGAHAAGPGFGPNGG